MNGETMYALKPLITKTLMTKSDNNCMYEMKNIHETSCPSNDHAASKLTENLTDISEKSPLPEVAILEARQEKILTQLAELKEQVLCLCDVLKFNNGSQKISNSPTIHAPVTVDLVINANPRKPCWAILALGKIWRDVNFDVTCYKHSSVEGSVPEFVVNSKEEYHDTVNVSLIWKRVEETEIVVSGVQGYPLIGETNFLRYLARQLPNKNYEKLSNELDVSRLENILDMSHRLLHEESPKDVQSILARIAEKLGEKNWLFSDEKSGIADVAAWSAIKQASITKIPSILKPWFERCENTFIK